MKRRQSIKTRVLTVLVLTQLPLMLIIISFTIYFVRYFNQSLARSNQNALASYCDLLEDELERLNIRMLNFVASDVYFKMLSSDTQFLDAHTHSLEIMNDYQTLLEENSLLYGCYIISSRHGFLRESYASGPDYAHNEQLRNWFGSYLQKEDAVFQEQWQPLMIQEKTFLYMVKGVSGTYSVYIIDMDSIHVPQDEQAGSGGTILFFEDSAVLNAPENGLPEEIQLTGSDKYYFAGDSQKYLVIEQPVAFSSMRAAYLMPYYGVLGNMSLMQRLVIILSVSVVIVLIPVGYFILRRVFFKPVDRLVGTMEAVREGKTETRADEEYTEMEFLTVNQTFNAMLTQINQLKIEAYEKELNLQRTQLDYYQTQIRPHFYVNCLKSIYGLLEGDRLEDSKKAVIYLSRHLRYMLKGPSVAVTLEEELSYVDNYIQLQTVSMAYPPRLTMEMDDSLKNMEIPAISILSFVENCVKYGNRANQTLMIGIFISRITSEDGSFINISVSDNGPGFPENIMELLNQGASEESEGHHIGIYNVIQRFRLYYGKDRVLFAFSNAEGAHVDVFIRCGDGASADREDQAKEGLG